jgi:hypothetical protein
LASYGKGKQLVEWIGSCIDLIDPDQDCHPVPIEFDIGYIEEGIGLVCQDDLRI